MKKIIFTGGGSAGHVTANLVLIFECTKENYEIHYIGSKNGIEQRLVAEFDQVHYHSVSTGKLRRYFDWKNFTDVYKVMKGIFQAYLLIRRLKPDVVFSLGGFVSVPVVLGAKLNGIATIIYEPDVHMGLANRISYPFATKVCTTFLETKKNNPSKKTIHIGALVKDTLKAGDRERGISFCNFTYQKPVLLVMGGSQGAERINQVVRAVLPDLLQNFQVIHLCGPGKIEASIQQEGYQQFEYVTHVLPDLLAAADIVVSRAGSNSIHELLALQKPMLLIPHTSGGTRNGQIKNAQNFQQAGYAAILMQETMTNQSFLDSVYHLHQNRETYIQHMKTNDSGKAVKKVMDVIKSLAKQNRNHYTVD
ncbi:undecaprenyldiphospho-muramoylpentapeptide beta-N-acetylglucosaminyltransferase [Brevibacillus laterosporus]|uniref:undecaprenyldiphospho-muramoylpentapeptide beta-N-acetylglucosaminyltransferase n=1 Tax=Brevibacillus laterosporus TaxID=1465 RepID=UPI0024059241|nr:undecaprenyldiphospho-muramoylpentapeptide beta-N-acetylglucosaminyltransferase [Brevibacillus laterosporus]MDF9413480.1 undecaprenyldiphospho-muramoylpentapeptide beta-N-acetylglucosaminyltransferase [Brevibacillus laterosporus]